MFCLKFFSEKSTSSEQCPPFSPIMSMPYLVIKEILKHSDLLSILILRRVCRDFRHFIDLHMRPLNIHKMHVSAIKQVETLESGYVRKESGTMIFHVPGTRDQLFLDYVEEEDGVSIYATMTWYEDYHQRIGRIRTKTFNGVLSPKRKKLNRFDAIFLENACFEEVFFGDFSWVLRKGSKLDMQSIHFFERPTPRRMTYAFSRAMESTSKPLRVKHFFISVFDHVQLLKILKNVDLEATESLNVGKVYGKDGKDKDIDLLRALEMNDLEKLKGWKDVKERWFCFQKVYRYRD